MPVQDLSTAVRTCVSCKRCFDPKIQFCPDCLVELISLELIPRLISSRYQLERVLGSGAFGTAFLARDLRQERDVVLKVIRAGAIADPQAQDRFLREAQLAAQLSHPQIGALYDYGMLPDASAWVVMELVHGESLRQLMNRTGKFAPNDAVAILTEIASALEVAHRAGLVHRDLKPECIVVLPVEGGSPQIKIYDFALAVITGGGPSSQAGAEAYWSATRVSGLLTYASPAMLRGEEADPQSDIYSLGVVGYEMLAGRPPFSARRSSELRAKHLNEAPPPLHQFVPGILPVLESAIMKALAKESFQRQQTAAEFKRDLLRAVNIR
ncbi:MAG TPA: serine/threonine-protein kinase [Blastocatellia bacterium]|nr:serine/threonine-protein kinase [Blastocatellia bacterium]